METMINPLTCSPEELNESHRAEMHAFAERHGMIEQHYYGLMRLGGYWEIANRHVADWVARSTASAREVTRAQKEEAKEAKIAQPSTEGQPPTEAAKAPTEAAERLCRDCGVILPERSGVGRRPVRCEPCKALHLAPRPKVAKAPPAAKAATQPVVGPAPEKLCIEAGCDKLIPPTGKQGRRPLRCPKHRAEHNDRISAELATKTRVKRTYDHSGVDMSILDKYPSPYDN